MILIDPREGSGDLLPLIAPRVNGQARHATPMLDSGDIAFEGNGPEGPITVGIEIKTLADALTSMRSGRLAEQVNGMLGDYQSLYLMIEGVWRPNEEGWIEVPQNGGWRVLNVSTREQAKRGRRASYLYSELDKFLTSLEQKRGMTIRRIPSFKSSRLEVVQQIVNLYQWWSKPWDSHDSVEHIKLCSGAPITGRKASTLRLVAAQMPEIGWDLSLRIERHFKTVEAFINADVEALMEVEWKTEKGRRGRISERLANVIYNAIRSKG